jgi:hypothetical protein
MKQINYSELFVNGRQIQAEWGEVNLKLHNAGNLVLPTGRIVACDPLTSPEIPPFTVSVLPNEYPVILSVANFNNNDQRVAYAMLRFDDKKPVRWKMALLPNQDVSSLKEAEVFYYGVRFCGRLFY